jgi:hypothetical protein
MKDQIVHCSIIADISPKFALEKIGQVSQWWISNVAGPSQSLGDVFTVSLGTTWKKFRITELLPENKVIWEVVDCNLPWLQDLKEWKGTQISWEVSAAENGTQINFTHNLVPEMPCFNQCEKAWGNYIGESLFKFITLGKGLPDQF